MNKKVTALTIISLFGVGTIVTSTPAASTTPTNESLSIPDNLNVPAGNKYLLQTSARGVQIYVCQPSQQNPNQFEWKLKAPEADLLGANGDRVGIHYQGPTWEYNDGSKVVGEVLERANSPDSNAIPWLLLKAKTHEGNGIFSRVTYIQRVNTSGGKAPAEGCDRSTVNTETRANYTTDYYYYVAQ